MKLEAIEDGHKERIWAVDRNKRFRRINVVKVYFLIEKVCKVCLLLGTQRSSFELIKILLKNQSNGKLHLTFESLSWKKNVN